MRVFRRDDVAAVRLTSCAGNAPITLSIAHIDLYFFYDIDIVLLNVEVVADNLTLFQAEDTLYRFGRAYPAGWDDDGEGLHCMHQVEWLGHDGAVLAKSDAAQREKFLAFVGRHRAPRICVALVVPAAARWCSSTRMTTARSATGCSSITACR